MRMPINLTCNIIVYFFFEQNAKFLPSTKTRSTPRSKLYDTKHDWSNICRNSQKFMFSYGEHATVVYAYNELFAFKIISISVNKYFVTYKYNGILLNRSSFHWLCAWSAAEAWWCKTSNTFTQHLFSCRSNDACTISNILLGNSHFPAFSPVNLKIFMINHSAQRYPMSRFLQLIDERGYTCNLSELSP